MFSFITSISCLGLQPFKLPILLLILLLSSNLYAGNTNSGADPTRPFSGSKPLNSTLSSENVEEKQIKLELQSIIEQGKQRKVIINGKILKKGEHIDIYQVIKINSDSVILKSAEQRLTLPLFIKVLS